MNFLDVRISHIDSASEEVASAARRFLVVELASFCCALVFMCFSSALDALIVCRTLTEP